MHHSGALGAHCSCHPCETATPLAAAYAQILSLAQEEGFLALYDPGNPNTRSLSSSGLVQRIDDALGNLPSLEQPLSMHQPNLKSIGHLEVLSTLAEQPKFLRHSPPLAEALTGDFSILALAQTDATSAQFFLDGLHISMRLALGLDASGKYLLFPGATVTGPLADNAPHIWSARSSASTQRTSLAIDMLTICDAPNYQNNPLNQTGLTYGERYISDGRSWQGWLGPLLIYRGELAENVRNRLITLLRTLAQLTDLPST